MSDDFDKSYLSFVRKTEARGQWLEERMVGEEPSNLQFSQKLCSEVKERGPGRRRAPESGRSQAPLHAGST